MIKKWNSMLALAAGLSLLGAAAQAATATGNMAVSATVTRTCTVSAGTLAFGTLNTAANSDAAATVTVNCTAGSSTDAPTLTFGLGANAGTTTQRNMKGGDSTTAVVPYNLFSDAARSTAVSASTAVATTTSNSGVDYTATIYGRVPASSTYQLGSYSDTVVVTVTYAGG